MDGLFYLDLHSHSTDASDDAGGTVEGYLKWLAGRRKRGYQVDGFVLTEHRGFDPEVNYDALAEQYGVVVLKGAELETDIGHVLVYGIGERLAREFDFSRVDLPSAALFAASAAVFAASAALPASMVMFASVAFMSVAFMSTVFPWPRA